MASETVQIVRATLEIVKEHWLKHGTPIKPEDAEQVAVDALVRVMKAESSRHTSSSESLPFPDGQ